MGFYGEYHHQIDEKGRIRIPAKLKDALGESPVIFMGADGCLFVYSKERADEVFAKMFEKATYADETASRVARRMMSSAVTDGEDKQGRITLTPVLLMHAGIKKNVVTIGAYDKVEIWSEERWSSYLDFDSSEYDKQLKEVSKSIAQ